MDGFKKLPKIQHFKEGGTVQRQIANFEKRERKTEAKADESQDKSMVKKGVKQHEAALHKGEPKTELKLKCGGRAKKEKGTVKKFASGGTVTVSAPYDTKYQDKTTKEWIPTGKKCGGGVYSAKKTAEDRKNIAAAKTCKPKMAEGGSIIDSIKAAGTKLKDNVMGTPEQNRIAQEQMNKQAAQGSKLAKFFGGKADAESAPAKKCGGKVKKMNTGGTAS